MELALEQLQDIGERLQLLRGQRVSKILLDGPQVGRTHTQEAHRFNLLPHIQIIPDQNILGLPRS
jgi:hypothetical protein